MTACTNRRFAHMLHLYELNLLSGKDLEAFELHLMECGACAAEIEYFQDVARYLSHAPQIKKIVSEAVGQVADSDKTAPVARLAPKTDRHWWKVIPVTLIVAAVLVLLLVKPWQIEIRPILEAEATEDKLTILYFSNMASGEEGRRLGRLATSLLITDLSESEYLTVTSSERLADIVALLGQESGDVDDDAVATQIGLRAGAHWILRGDILQVTPEIVLSFQVIEMSTGDVVLSRRISAADNDDIFKVIDKLSIEIKKELSLPVEALEEPDRRVAEMTSLSLDAYDHYLEGVTSYRKLYYREAAENLRSALAIDSTIPMAYYYLSLMSDRNLIDLAGRYIERASSLGQLYIRSRQASVAGDKAGYIRELQTVIEKYPNEKRAYYLLGAFEHRRTNLEAATDYLRRAIEIDPLYKLAYNELAYVYVRDDNLEAALWAINKYISISPGDARPHDTRGDLYAINGNIDMAIESYKHAVEIKPDFSSSLTKLGNMYICKGDPAEAEKWYRRKLSDPSAFVRFGTGMDVSYIPIREGRFERALEILDSTLAVYRADMGSPTDYSTVYTLKANLYATMNRIDEALAVLEEGMVVHEQFEPGDRAGLQPLYARLLSRDGRARRADSMVTNYEQLHQQKGLEHLRGLYAYVAGVVDLERGDYNSAVVYLEEATASTEPSTNFQGFYLLGRAYLGAGRLRAAVSTLEKLSGIYMQARIGDPVHDVKLRYFLGRAYEASGWEERAADQYRKFLGFWGDADWEIPEVIDAEDRLKYLESKS